MHANKAFLSGLGTLENVDKWWLSELVSNFLLIAAEEVHIVPARASIIVGFLLLFAESEVISAHGWLAKCLRLSKRLVRLRLSTTEVQIQQSRAWIAALGWRL